MKKFNLNKEKIYVSSFDVLKALNLKKEFIITLDGQLKFDFKDDELIIFKGSFPPNGLLGSTPTLKSVLGDGYIVKLVDNQFEINCAGAWQRVSDFNIVNAVYEDAGEGINEFDDKELEQIGWYATDFDITYRDIVNVIEQSECDMILLCSEIDEDYYLFNGLAFINDIECARDRVRDFVITKINNKLSNDSLYKRDELNDDQLEALEYFNLLI